MALNAMTGIMLVALFIGFGIGVLIALIKEIKQYQRGVKFVLGKYTETLNPGWRLIIPVFQSLKLIDIRQKTIDLKKQEVMTKDQVSLNIDGVVFYFVEKAEEVVLNVHNIERQISDKATSELKEVISNMSMSDALKSRDLISSKLQKALHSAVKDEEKPWGVVIKAVQINNLELSESLTRAMAKEAEAEREKKAIVIRAQGEHEAAQKYKEAAKLYDDTALRLRELKTYEEIGKENNTLIIVGAERIFGGKR